jgi:hypothetical protein
MPSSRPVLAHARADAVPRRPRRRIGAVLVASALAALASGLGGVAHSAAAPGDPPVTYFFHGGDTDDANRATGAPYAQTFSTAAPTDASGSRQTAVNGANNKDQPANLSSVFWTAPFTGTLQKDIEFRWFWSAPDAPVDAIDAYVTVFKDVDYASKTGTKIAQAELTLAAGAQPALSVNRLALSAAAVPVATNLLIQVTPRYVNTGDGLTAHYDSTATPSSFVSPAPVVTGPQVAHVADTPVSFGPAAIVSAHYLGSEPQTTMERPVPGSQPGAVDPNRVFIDWPLTSDYNTGQLSRSTDGGDTFRLLLDETCAARQRPNCFTGGGGDTETEVNPITGTLYFGDQELVAQEAIATSTDHGDTFPVQRQIAATAPATGVDRQWLAPLAPGILSVGGQEVHAFYTYHVPLAGQYIVGITAAGVPVPQPAPQIASVEQSGQVRVDNTNGPGRGWIYQPYRRGGKYQVATAKAADYATATGWQVNTVATMNPTIFPWLSLDTHGNAYATWVTGAEVFYSYSLIDDPANNPLATPAGRPGTKWSPAVRINPQNIGSAVFPEIIAGDPGKVAIAYDGTTDYTGVQDNAPPDTRWHTYVSVLTNALAENGAPIEIRTGRVSHRIIHTGNICTSGTACATGNKDRSLLDMIDLGVDASGRVGVVFTDNNSAMQTPTNAANTREYPFVHFAKQVAGPALFGTTPIAVTVPQGARGDAAGDATWPNRAGGTLLPSLDALSASLKLEGTEVVARVPLADATAARMTADLATYNASRANVPAAERLQYVVRFSTNNDTVVNGKAGDVFHLSMEQLADGTRRFFGGKLDGNDKIYAPADAVGYVIGAAYRSDASYAVTGAVEGNTLVLRAPASAFGVTSGQSVYSVTAFTMAGPSEANDTQLENVERTVDVTPPFDAVLGTDPDPGTDVPEVPVTLLLPLVAVGLMLTAYRVRRTRGQGGSRP